MPSIQFQTATIPPLPSMLEKKNTLSEQINTATRTTHHQLNKLILSRLPLALPPFVENPSVYTTGLLHIAPIYFTFETLWSQIIETIPDSNQPNGNRLFDASISEQKFSNFKGFPLKSGGGFFSPLACAPRVSSRIRSLLRYLQLPELLRSRRLLADIQNLTRASDDEIQKQIEAVSITGSLAKFLEYTKNSVERNPHVILAYAWVLYMALFSGGRYIRSSLKDAGGSGDSFWNQDFSQVRLYDDIEVPSSPRTCVPTFIKLENKPRPFPTSQTGDTISRMASSLQFFHFVGSKDGEDIKAEFKKRISEVEEQLTDREKADIVSESQYIFKFMSEMINDLDEVMESQEGEIEITTLMRESKLLMTARDSISLARHRICQNDFAKKSERKQKPGIFHGILESPRSRLFKITAPPGESPSKEPLTRIRFLSSQVDRTSICYNQSYPILSCVGALICIFIWCWFGGRQGLITQIFVQSRA